RIETRAAQTLHAREQAQRRDEPAAERILSWPSGVRIDARDQRRRQVKLQLEIVSEVLAQTFQEPRLRVQARDFVLVLVCEQLEVAAGDRLGERRCAKPDLLLELPNPRNALAIARRVCLVLIVDEERR